MRAEPLRHMQKPEGGGEGGKKGGPMGPTCHALGTMQNAASGALHVHNDGRKCY